MAVRGALLSLLTWRFGDGSVCNALAQPWFPGAVAAAEVDASRRGLKVRDLMASDSNAWNVEMLIEIFGYQNCLYILENVQIPREGTGDDVLIFTGSTHGRFSVKQAYNKGTGHNSAGVNDPVWKLIWGQCGQGEEDVIHMLFLCPFARACWLMGPLAIRNENLPSNLGMIFTSLTSHISYGDWTAMANSAWCVWRCRNEKVYEGKAPSCERFTQLLKVVSLETRVAASVKCLHGLPRNIDHNKSS